MQILLLHDHPNDSKQSGSHPSITLKLPSSQVSFPAKMPSPHKVLQVDETEMFPPLQYHPLTSAVQFELHLDESERSPSSQYSDSITNPSPHFGMHFEAVVEFPVVQTYKGFTP